MADNTLYLGDGAYVEITEDVVVLYTHDGIRTTNQVILGQSELSALLRFLSDRGLRA